MMEDTDRCLNGHSRTYTEVRPNGAKICRKCTRLYETEQHAFGRNRKRVNGNERVNH